MLKVECDKEKGTCSIESSGGLIEIIADVAYVIAAIGSSLDKKNHSLGEAYEHALKGFLNAGGALDSPVERGGSVSAIGQGRTMEDALDDAMAELRELQKKQDHN